MITLNNFLPKFREFVSARESWPTMVAELQEQVAEEIEQMQLAKSADVYGLIEAVPFIVQDTHTRFRRCVDLQPPPERVLCAPVSVKDRIISLNRSMDFFYWACCKEKMPEKPYDQFLQGLEQNDQEIIKVFGDFVKEVVKKAQDPSVETKVHNLEEVLAAIVRTFPQEKKGLKPILNRSFSQERKRLKPELKRSLEDYIKEYIEYVRSGKAPPEVRYREVLGGASAIIADVMAELHQRDVWVYTTYNSKEQSQLYEPFALWWDPRHGQTNDPAQKTGNCDHPTRYSYIFEFDQELTLTDAQGNPIQDAQSNLIQAHKKDRVVFRIPSHIGIRHLDGNLWSRAVLEDEHEDWVTPLSVRGDDEWPYAPGFLRLYLNDNETLHIRFLGKDRLERIARDNHYIVLGGVELHTFQRPASVLLVQALVGQLEILTEERARLHLELSGGVRKGDRLMPLARSIRGTIQSVGLNDEELAGIAGLRDFPLKGEDMPAWAGSIYRCYLQAKAMANILSLDRLYVHGNEVDLILRRNATPGVMRQEIQADLFTKGLVILAILKRSFKADWVDKARKLEGLILAKKGFQALLRFALDLYKGGGWNAEALEAFARNGYYCDRAPGTYSLAIVPVVWPRLPENIISTGAGDICSGITVVYAGY
jgi:hypothetical protein